MAIPAKVTITQGNTQDIKLFGLQDVDSGTFWTAATASATLYDQYGNQTSLANVTLTYQPGSNGNYLGTFTTDFDLPVAGGYVLKIDAAQGAAKYHLELPAQVAIRVS